MFAGFLLSIAALAGLPATSPMLHGNLDPRQFDQTTTMSSTLVTVVSTFVEQWTVLPQAFSACESTFQQGVTTTQAEVAIISLRKQVKTVLESYGVCNCQPDGTSTYVDAYSKIIAQIFNSWQSILSHGQKYYASQWTSVFQPLFRPFSVFVEAIGKSCSFLGIDLNALLAGIHLNLDLFVGIGLNLDSLLGGILGAVGGLLGGLLGGGGSHGGLIGGIL